MEEKTKVITAQQDERDEEDFFQSKVQSYWRSEEHKSALH